MGEYGVTVKLSSKYINSFLRNMFRYDSLWREAAAANPGRIHCVTFEGLKTELMKNVEDIVDFLGLENVDIEKVVEGSNFKSHDKDFNKSAKITDTDSSSETIVKVRIKC